jgi:hypothetical protein
VYIYVTNINRSHSNLHLFQRKHHHQTSPFYAMSDDEEEHVAPYQDDGFVVPPDALLDTPSVMRMPHPLGGELFILGTAHVSEKSAADVKHAVNVCKVSHDVCMFSRFFVLTFFASA